jgi:hypothetical protein
MLKITITANPEVLHIWQRRSHPLFLAGTQFKKNGFLGLIYTYSLKRAVSTACSLKT